MEEIKFEKVPVGIFDKVKTNKEEFVEKFIDELEELFPDTVKDGKVDFQALLERFGEYEDRDEKYELTWVGKNKARQESFEDIVGKTLKYIEEDSKNPETTENLYIEGDNLEVLKLLRKSYYGKIKMIYIDPPYNRRKGDDLIYRDDFTLTKQEYDKLKGDVDEYGNRLVKNSADSGRYHSNWINMMYPRLQVAKDLLTDDGVIFISIDDNEVHNMRKVCDEIFGEKNFVDQLSVINNLKGRSDDEFFATGHEYLLVVAKNKRKLAIKGFELEDEELDNEYSYQDEIGFYKLIGFRKTGKGWEREERPYMFYPVLYKNDKFDLIDENEYKNLYDANTNKFNDVYLSKIIDKYEKMGYEVILPTDTEGNYGRWRWGIDTFRMNKDVNLEKNNSGTLCTKMRATIEDGSLRTKTAKSIWYKPEYDTGGAGKKLNKLFESNRTLFDNPKSLYYIKDILHIITKENDIILDFFSGSATTAHAVMQLNAEDGGRRKFIMVQLPEPTDKKSEAAKAGYKNICQIGKERIRRGGEKILEENKDKEGIESLDTGFKVFRVEDTNFKRIVDTSIGADIAEMKYKNMKDSEDFNPHFTDLDVVYELMLRRQDIELTEEIKKLDNIGDRTYIVGDTMLVCLEEKISEEMVEKIGNIDTDLSWIVLRDSAFDDDCDLKVNTTRKLRTIIKESRKKDQKIYWI